MEQRHFTIDEAKSGIEQAQPIGLKKKRGRPLGSKSRTWVGHGQDFTNADFAFMRAHLLGVEVRQAAVRYLLHLDISTTRDSKMYFEALMSRLEALSRAELFAGDEENTTARSAIKDVLAWRDDVNSIALGKAQPAPAPAPAPEPKPLPSIDEFMVEADMDGFSEEEILYAYQEKYADQIESMGAVADSPALEEVAPASQDPFTPRRLAAVADSLALLQGKISVCPGGADTTQAWLPPQLADRLRPFGVLTLADLSNWINIKGRGWYSDVPAVGKGRAHRLMQWLIDNESTIGVELNEMVKASVPTADGFEHERSAVQASKGAEISQWEALEFGIVPLQQLDWPVRLRGLDGVFRSRDDNTYGATDDAEAIRLWLAQYTNSPNTLEAYSRSIEWLVLWAVVEQGKSISSLTRSDLMSFKSFLLDPPAHWIQTARVTKYSKHWRPLRGKLSESSVEHAMRAVSAMFSALREANYLKANAAKGLVRTKRTEVTMDTTRSLSNQDIEVVAATLAEMPDSPRKRRYRALLLLMQTTGLRRSELCSLNWANVKRARTGNNESDVWQVTFLGKGSKERKLPITLQTYQALLAHKEDRIELSKGRKMGFFAQLESDEWPLIGILDDAQAQEREAKDSDFVYDSGRVANTSGALSLQRLHTIIKTFFKACVATAQKMGRDSESFERASLHWLRHTFAHQILAATDKDLAVTQQLLGHSSIAVTSIYVKADMSQRIEAVKKVDLKY